MNNFKKKFLLFTTIFHFSTFSLALAMEGADEEKSNAIKTVVKYKEISKEIPNKRLAYAAGLENPLGVIWYTQDKTRLPLIWCTNKEWLEKLDNTLTDTHVQHLGWTNVEEDLINYLNPKQD
ncbi:MAG: hypothetical protein K2W92_07545 [Alphaproteobacteria bacterium]|nr:hypothetical protein [Alphaproteobacteria bacterium]